MKQENSSTTPRPVISSSESETEEGRGEEGEETVKSSYPFIRHASFSPKIKMKVDFLNLQCLC